MLDVGLVQLCVYRGTEGNGMRASIESRFV